VAVVHAASVQDRDGAELVLRRLHGCFPRLVRIWADTAYRGKLIEWAHRFGGWTLEIVSRAARQKGFVVLPKRWIVERTLGWLGRSRRLSKDYEALPESSEAWIYLSMIHLMLRRLDP
jgi:putative transposase